MGFFSASGVRVQLKRRWVLPLPGSTLMERQCVACTRAMGMPPSQRPTVPSQPTAWGPPKLTENEHGLGIEKGQSLSPVGGGGRATQTPSSRQEPLCRSGAVPCQNPTGALSPPGVHTAQRLLQICLQEERFLILTFFNPISSNPDKLS